MKSLVTGGAGFIGSHIVDRLLSLGHEVVVIDNESSEANEKSYWNTKAQNYKLDICDYINTKELYDQVDYVFHLAADARLQSTILNPIQATATNTLGTNVVLQCAKEAGVKRVIYSSTSSAYGNNPIPNIETQPDDCLNPYSVTKVAGEKLCSMYTNLFGLDTIIFRYFNVYGDRQPSVGTHALVAGIFDRQYRSNQNLTVVGDGKQRRDFVSVEDIVDINIMSATIDLDRNYFGQVFNVGSATNCSVIEIAEMFDHPITYIEARSGEAEETLANIEKVKEVFDWKPSKKIEDYIDELKRRK
jgi:UDP-glucose 4-epimerase